MGPTGLSQPTLPTFNLCIPEGGAIVHFKKPTVLVLGAALKGTHKEPSAEWGEVWV